MKVLFLEDEKVGLMSTILKQRLRESTLAILVAASLASCAADGLNSEPGIQGTNQNAQGLGSGTYIRYNLAGYLPTARKMFVINSSTNLSGQAWTVKNSSNATVASGTVSASVTGAGQHTNFAYNHKIDLTTSVTTVGTYTLTVGTQSPVTFSIANNPYGTVVSDMLHYLYIERSGDTWGGTTPSPRIGASHTGDSSLQISRPSNASTSGVWDAPLAGTSVNMQGGYYSDGDYIKFTLTNANLVWMLLHAYTANPNMFLDSAWPDNQSGLVDVLDAAKFGLDYLMKTYPVDGGNEFIIQVGDKNDHRNLVDWRMPENDTWSSYRNAHSVLSKAHMGLTAAALAKGAQVFANISGYSTIATNYQNKAKAIIDKANASGLAGPFWESDTGGDFYKDTDVADNMALGNWEVGVATGTTSYKTTAINLAPPAQGWSSYADLALLANLSMGATDSASLTRALSDIGTVPYATDTFLSNSRLATNIWGLTLSTPTWSSLATLNGAAASAAWAAKINTSDSNRLILAQDQMDYLFGKNNWGLSFVATTSFPSTTHVYNQIAVKSNTLARGAVTEGACDRTEHDAALTEFTSLTVATSPQEPFNAKGYVSDALTWVFYDNETDYATSEAGIYGQGTAIWLIAEASPQVSGGTTYTLTASTGANGTVTPAGTTTVSSGASQTYTITPSTGYSVATLTVDGSSVTPATSYTFSNVTANHTISATFSSGYTITSSAGANGSVSPTTATVASGGSQQIIFTPNTGYTPSGLLVDGQSAIISLSFNPTTYFTNFTNVTANHTVSISFTINTFTITTSAGANGSITSTQTVNYGSNSTITITPNCGYAVSTLTVDGSSVTAATSYTFSNVTAAHSISATFAASSTSGPGCTCPCNSGLTCDTGNVCVTTVVDDFATGTITGTNNLGGSRWYDNMSSISVASGLVTFTPSASGTVDYGENLTSGAGPMNLTGYSTVRFTIKSGAASSVAVGIKYGSSCSSYMVLNSAVSTATTAIWYNVSLSALGTNVSQVCSIEFDAPNSSSIWFKIDNVELY